MDLLILYISEDELRHTYTEVEPEQGLVEFQDPLPSVPLYTDILTEGGIRTAAVACESGFLRLTVVDEEKNELLR